MKRSGVLPRTEYENMSIKGEEEEERCSVLYKLKTPTYTGSCQHTLDSRTSFALDKVVLRCRNATDNGK